MSSESASSLNLLLRLLIFFAGDEGMTKVVVGGGMSGEMASPDDEAVEGLESTQGEILQCSDICQYSTIVMQYDMIDCMYVRRVLILVLAG